ncbi:hypothetical protein AWZ03_012802 [Drosophila navojoa]|uniref:Uncharacterized protein n=1 Tax=Drosophila navojoa TaxID=7232 RepID=A0A484AY56_DRONA|nr:uncharacterized protein LOC115564600 [Drosophila navojoa]TDG40780.1 hypothetical protein AWZ03_012802 [Drosophila navojoa]
MLKRELQSIQLKLSDLEEYESVRRRNKIKAATDSGRQSSATATATETALSTSATSDSTSETPVTQRQIDDLPPTTGWSTAVVTSSSNTNSGSTEDDTSVVAVADDNDTAAELSDDGWVDVDEEDGARGGE